MEDLNTMNNQLLPRDTLREGLRKETGAVHPVEKIQVEVGQAPRTEVVVCGGGGRRKCRCYDLRRKRRPFACVGARAQEELAR